MYSEAIGKALCKCDAEIVPATNRITTSRRVSQLTSKDQNNHGDPQTEWTRRSEFTPRYWGQLPQSNGVIHYWQQMAIFFFFLESGINRHETCRRGTRTVRSRVVRVQILQTFTTRPKKTVTNQWGTVVFKVVLKVTENGFPHNQYNKRKTCECAWIGSENGV